MKLMGKEIDDAEFSRLMSEQAKGKVLTQVGDKVIAIEPVLSEKDKAESELFDLRKWFDIDYMRLEQKYRRLHTLGKLTDNGTNGYDELIALYTLAEQKRQRIKELEAIIAK